jgi:hypothetical protein
MVTESATDPEPLHRVMGEGERARLILTDEPYGVPIAGNVTKGHRREFTMVSGRCRSVNFWRSMKPGGMFCRISTDGLLGTLHRLARPPADEMPRL